MSITGIVLIVAGVIVLALGYLVPVRKKDMDTESLLISEDEIRKMVDRELENVKTHIADIVDETVTYSMEKTERSMERVANEKIMAVNEYSDTVLEEINKNHKEVIFLYDMLNDKHENLKAAVVEATQTTDEVRQTLKDAEVTAMQADRAIEHVEMLAGESQEAIKGAMEELAKMGELLKVAAYERETRKYQAPSAYHESAYEEDYAQEEEFTEEEDFTEDENFVEEEDFAEEDFVEEEFTKRRNLAYEEPVYDDEPEFEQTVTTETMRFDDDEDDYFVPIAPPRVHIIHEPDGDYVDDQMPAEPLPEREEIRKPARRQSAPKKTTSRHAAAKTARRSMEPEYPTARMTDAKSVNIQFANGRDNGRNSNERILELHKAGKSNMAIAKELGLGIGEVKLVIDLFEGL